MIMVMAMVMVMAMSVIMTVPVVVAMFMGLIASTDGQWTDGMKATGDRPGQLLKCWIKAQKCTGPTTPFRWLQQLQN